MNVGIQPKPSQLQFDALTPEPPNQTPWEQGGGWWGNQVPYASGLKDSFGAKKKFNEGSKINFEVVHVKWTTNGQVIDVLKFTKCYKST